MFGVGAAGGSEFVLIHLIIARLDIEDEELTGVLRLYLGAYLPFVDRLPACCDLLGGVSGVPHR
jgi:hypothetical protein